MSKKAENLIMGEETLKAIESVEAIERRKKMSKETKGKGKSEASRFYEEYNDEQDKKDFCYEKCSEAAAKHNTTAIKVAKAVDDMMEVIYLINILPVSSHRMFGMNIKELRLRAEKILKKAGIKC